jgi:hypothetical protein
MLKILQIHEDFKGELIYNNYFRPRSPSPLLRRPLRPGLAPSTTAAPATSEQTSEEVAAPEVPAETTSEATQSSQVVDIS